MSVSLTGLYINGSLNTKPIVGFKVKKVLNSGVDYIEVVLKNTGTAPTVGQTIYIVLNVNGEAYTEFSGAIYNVKKDRERFTIYGRSLSYALTNKFNDYTGTGYSNNMDLIYDAVTNVGLGASLSTNALSSNVALNYTAPPTYTNQSALNVIKRACEYPFGGSYVYAAGTSNLLGPYTGTTTSGTYVMLASAPIGGTNPTYYPGSGSIRVSFTIAPTGGDTNYTYAKVYLHSGSTYTRIGAVSYQNMTTSAMNVSFDATGLTINNGDTIEVWGSVYPVNGTNDCNLTNFYLKGTRTSSAAGDIYPLAFHIRPDNATPTNSVLYVERTNGAARNNGQVIKYSTGLVASPSYSTRTDGYITKATVIGADNVSGSDGTAGTDSTIYRLEYSDATDCTNIAMVIVDRFGVTRKSIKAKLKFSALFQNTNDQPLNQIYTITDDIPPAMSDSAILTSYTLTYPDLLADCVFEQPFIDYDEFVPAINTRLSETERAIPSITTDVSTATTNITALQNQPLFSVYANTDTTFSSGETWYILKMNTEIYDTASKYDTTNYKFVAPADGYYHLDYGYALDHGANYWAEIAVVKNLSDSYSPSTSKPSNIFGRTAKYTGAGTNSGNDYYNTVNGSCIVYLAKDETIKVVGRCESTSNNAKGGSTFLERTYFMGHKI